MRKAIFILMIFVSIALGTYLGICYPPDVLSQKAEEVKEAVADSNIFDLLPSEAPIVTATPTVTPEQNPYVENIPELPEIADVTETPKSANVPYNANGILGHLIVGGNSVMVRDSITEDALAKSPGWMPDSALPGTDGMSVILGHRNRKHLKLIENVKVGDALSFRFVSDNHLVSYTVTEVQIFEKTADWTLPVTDENVLVLVTCYPFQYTGNAPGKFQVICHLRG
jgi:LPXTG-site transpeptidase (sortase) family protein